MCCAQSDLKYLITRCLKYYPLPSPFYPPRHIGFDPNFPSTSPYVTSVGGTYISGSDEKSWNYSGGGFSTAFPMPAPILPLTRPRKSLLVGKRTPPPAAAALAPAPSSALAARACARAARPRVPARARAPARNRGRTRGLEL